MNSNMNYLTDTTNGSMTYSSTNDNMSAWTMYVEFIPILSSKRNTYKEL